LIQPSEFDFPKTLTFDFRPFDYPRPADFSKSRLPGEAVPKMMVERFLPGKNRAVFKVRFAPLNLSTFDTVSAPTVQL
jgi:hypothetical protein